MNGEPGARFAAYEYAYYGLIVYASTGEALGIDVPLLGAVGFAVLAGLCILRLEAGAPVRMALTAPLLVAGSFVTIQMVVHGESLLDDFVRSMVTWMLVFIIVQSLCTRPGFVQRFSVAAFLMGLALLPFVEFEQGRAGLDPAAELANSNPNNLAAWFGFCALAFTIRGLETRRSIDRWGSWMIATFSLVIVGLTVSRTPVAALAITIVIALRKRLKRGFLPVLGLIALLGISLAFGLFDSAIESYTDRGLEDTGRLTIWALALGEFLEEPLTGVGVSDIALVVPFTGQRLTPHNGALFLALGAGVVPLFFFLMYWLAALRGARKGSVMRGADAAYLFPLLLYSFLISMAETQEFTKHWAVVSVGLCLHYLGSRHGGRIRRQLNRVAPKAGRNNAYPSQAF